MANQKHSLFQSFSFAFAGIRYAVSTQRNVRIQLVAAVAAITAAIFWHFSTTQWAILILTIAAVLILEFLNTAIETIVDIVTPEFHPLAKIAKDVSAAAVLLASIAAACVGVLLFLF